MYTTKRHFQIDQTLTDSGFIQEHFKRAISFFQRIQYPLQFYSLSSDATAILPELTWRSKDDALLGLNIPDDLLPNLSPQAGYWIENVIELVAEYGLATQVEILALNPIIPGYPSFTIAAFAQKATPKAEGVVRRWITAANELKQHGVDVISFQSDGAPAQLKAMQSVKSDYSLKN